MTSSQECRPYLDEQFETVADATRREVLASLMDDGSRGATPTEGVEVTVRPDESVELHHVHLPKLEERGYVHWDRDERRVSRGPRFGEIEPLLTVLSDHADDLSGELA